MTPTEWTAIVTFVTGALGGVFGVGVTYGIVRTQIRGHGARIGKLELSHEMHMKDPSPHVICATHSIVLNGMGEKIDKLVEHHEKLDERIYAMLTNGGPKHKQGPGELNTLP